MAPVQDTKVKSKTSKVAKPKVDWDSKWGHGNCLRCGERSEPGAMLCAWCENVPER